MLAAVHCLLLLIYFTLLMLSRHRQWKWVWVGFQWWISEGMARLSCPGFMTLTHWCPVTGVCTWTTCTTACVKRAWSWTWAEMVCLTNTRWRCDWCRWKLQQLKATAHWHWGFLRPHTRSLIVVSCLHLNILINVFCLLWWSLLSCLNNV